MTLRKTKSEHVAQKMGDCFRVCADCFRLLKSVRCP